MKQVGNIEDRGRRGICSLGRWLMRKRVGAMSIASVGGIMGRRKKGAMWPGMARPRDGAPWPPLSSGERGEEEHTTGDYAAY